MSIFILIISSFLLCILFRFVSKCMYDVNSDLYFVIIVCMRFRWVCMMNGYNFDKNSIM